VAKAMPGLPPAPAAAAAAGTTSPAAAAAAQGLTLLPFPPHLLVCSWCTSVPLHTRRILRPGLTTRPLTICSQCTNNTWPGPAAARFTMVVGAPVQEGH